MKDKIKDLRYWVVSLLLTEGEKYLLMHTVLDRAHNLAEKRVSDKFIDTENIGKDIADLYVLKSIFSTDLYE